MRKQGSGKLEALIREEAKKNIGALNGLEMLKFHRHNQICKKLVEFSDKYNYPMTQLVYVGVGKNAHRLIVFEKGYFDFNEETMRIMEEIYCRCIEKLMCK